MMKKYVENLPGWVFELDEVSAGVYKVIGKHALGCSLEATGTDPEELMVLAVKDAQQMEMDLKRKKGL